MNRSGDLFTILRFDNEEVFFTHFNNRLIDIVDEYEHTLLHIAIANKKRNIAIYLINMGIDVNNQDYRGATALHFLGDYPDIEIAKAIIDHGGRLDIKDKWGNTPLWPAVFYIKLQADYELVRLYMKNGADPHSINKVGKSPLNLAETFGEQTLIAILKGET